MNPRRIGALLVTILTIAIGGAAADDRLRAIRDEISRLREDVASLGRDESGLVGELDRLSASLRLREAEAQEVALRLEAIDGEVRRREARIEELAAARVRRAAYLRFRVREMYKQGPVSVLAHWLDAPAERSAVAAFRYAAFLNERDTRALEEWRETGSRLESEREALKREEARLLAVRRENDRARERLVSVRAARSDRLDEVRSDRRKYGRALAELESAAEELDRLSMRPDDVAPEAGTLDIRAFRGLLDRPVDAPVATGFGNRIHPRFRTVVPHPGWDLDAPAGEPFRAVFDGTVAFAAWLRGYGLTVLVDHGHGIVTVYAHASSLLVEAGEAVARGAVLGTVGDTGSLRGPFLYFEIRDGGRPVDPGTWMQGPSVAGKP